MGTDISGWVEVRAPVTDQDPRWRAVVRIDWIVSRNYGMFGSLFGVRNDYGFRPIAPSRGLPHDVSSELKGYGDAPLESSPEWVSWITWREIREIDWGEQGEDPLPGKGRTEHARREEVVTRGWRTLLDIMEVLARQFEDDGVRLVVWFD